MPSARYGNVEVAVEGATLPEAQAYCRYAAEEREKVERFWGASWTDLIRIDVSPKYEISKALTLAHAGRRGCMEMPLRRMRENSGGLVHEFVHIYAPSDNRFLAEGLAVHLHSKLAGNPAPPNFGEDLHELAAPRLPDVASLAALNSVRTPRRLNTATDARTAYILAGSFVGYLMERYELDDFRAFYESGNYERDLAKPLEALEADWRLSIAPGFRDAQRTAMPLES
jgi:hypothetical protein